MGCKGGRVNEPDVHQLVVIDGAGDRYEVCDFDATFTLRSEKTGKYVTVGSAALGKLGLEWNGREIRRIGS